MTKSAEDMISVSTSTVIEIISSQLEAAEQGLEVVPPFLWGPPGVGKSSLVAQAAAKMGVGFIDLRLVQMDPVDLRGLPYLMEAGENGVKAFGFAQPSYLPTNGRGVLFLDELPQANPMVMNAASELVLDRRCGDYKLPQGWIVVAAGNRRTDRSATNELPGHMKNRFAHLLVTPQFEDWMNWAKTPRAEGGGEIHEGLVQYLERNRSRLNEYNPNMVSSPTSRTWEFVSRVLKTVQEPEARNAMIAGCIGKNGATELRAFLFNESEIPSLAEVLNDPEGVQIPDSPQLVATLMENLAAAASPDDSDKIAKFLVRCSNEHAMVFLTQVWVGKDQAKWAKSEAMAPMFKSAGLTE